MVKRLISKFNSIRRSEKVSFAIILLAFVIGLLLVIFDKQVAVTSHVILDKTIESVAEKYIQSDESYIKYQGHNLRLDFVEQTCDSCYILHYSYDIKNSLILKTSKTIKAIIYLENSEVTSAQYIRT